MNGSKMQESLYIEIGNGTRTTQECPIDTVITVFVTVYCDSKALPTVLVQGDSKPAFLSVPTDATEDFDALRCNYSSIPDEVKQCSLPAIRNLDGTLVRCGLCGVLRHVVHVAAGKTTDRQLTELLGYKGMCLKSCAEVSAWTKFCEVELPNLVSEELNPALSSNWSRVSKVLSKFENHLKEPPVIHNIGKHRREGMTKAKKRALVTGCTSPLNLEHLPELQHLFAEGPDMTLTDLLLFPCIHLILSNLRDSSRSMSEVLNFFPKICEWFERMKRIPRIEMASELCGFGQIPELKCNQERVTPLESVFSKLQIRDEAPKKIRASVSQVNDVLQKLKASNIYANEADHPEKGQLHLNWEELDEAVNPREGDLPHTRVQRKCEQLENIAAVVKSLCQPGQTIVDFCAGGGHVGILLAYLLPECKVIVVENKEESIQRAQDRISKLRLKNIVSYQCNMDYFTGAFDIGVCLHACGVATDLVLQTCIDKGANFVICPCCYGSVRNTHTITYPRSQIFRNSPVSYQEFVMLGHAADQTQVNIPQAVQGKECMMYIDTDRVLLAKQVGYEATLCSMIPLTCSPKNNLIIGTKIS